VQCSLLPASDPIWQLQIKVDGPEALKAMEWMCTAEMDKPIGSATYSLMLNEAGGIEADVTVTRLTDSQFYIVTGAAFTQYILARMEKILANHDTVVKWGCQPYFCFFFRKYFSNYNFFMSAYLTTVINYTV
jgi:hypothetical protein